MSLGRTFFADDFRDLVGSCAGFYERNKDKIRVERVGERRRDLSGYAEVFHTDCGTLTEPVQKRIEDLQSGVGLVLMTAHQPNFFAYSGVLRKATLTFLLAKKLEEHLQIPVVNFFGIADQDFTDDRWVRSCELPAVLRSDGVMSLDVKLPEKLMLHQAAKPSTDTLKEWKGAVEKWLAGAVRSVTRLGKDQGLEGFSSTPAAAVLHENFGLFWQGVMDCYARSKRYSDFNAFLMSWIVNRVWGYDTVFARFSECQQAFVDEFEFLLSGFTDYSRLLTEAQRMPGDEGWSGGVSDQEPFLAPFWYHCDCGSKAKLFLTEKDGVLFGEGKCEGCMKSYQLCLGAKDDPDLSEIASRMSARAIPMSLVFFDGLSPCCYVGGVGGVRYLMEAEHVANGLGILFPPIAVWRPRDRYLGVGQMEALLEMKRICQDYGGETLSEARSRLESRITEIDDRVDQLEKVKKGIIEKLKMHPNREDLKEEIKRVSIRQTKIKRTSNLSVIIRELKILENVSTVLDLIPSIIDYAVNVGLQETSDQWIKYLTENGDLASDVHLESVLNRNPPNYQLEL